MPNPDDPLATETIEHRRRIEAADARFRATLSQALRRGEETLQGGVGRHKRLRNFSQPPAPGEEAVNLKAPAGSSHTTA